MIQVPPDRLARAERLAGFLKADPENLLLRRDAARAALEARQFERTLEFARQHGQAVPPDAELEFLLGTALLALRRFDDAAAVFDALRVRGEGGDAAIYNLAYARAQLCDFAGVRQALERQAEPFYERVPGATVLWALACAHVGHAAPGIERLERHLRSHAEDGEAWGLLGLLQHDENNLHAAEIAIEAALRIDPQQCEALLAKGGIELERRNGSEARAVFQAVLSRVPRSGRAWSGLGFARLLLLDVAGARQAFEHAVETMQDHIGTWHGLAWCQVLGNDLAGAEASLRRALTLDRNFADTHGALAVLSALRGETGEAARMARRASGLNPRSMPARYAKALVSGSLEGSDKARETISEIIASPMSPGEPSLKVLVDEVVAKLVRPRG